MVLPIFLALFFSSNRMVHAQIGGFDDYYDFDEGGDNYRGKYIGDLATFHHQVSDF